MSFSRGLHELRRWDLSEENLSFASLGKWKCYQHSQRVKWFFQIKKINVIFQLRESHKQLTVGLGIVDVLSKRRVLWVRCIKYHFLFFITVISSYFKLFTNNGQQSRRLTHWRPTGVTRCGRFINANPHYAKSLASLIRMHVTQCTRCHQTHRRCQPL